MVMICLGCSGKPSRVHPPRIDPAQAGSGAIGQYDADGDGELPRKEMAKLPGVLLSLEAYDLDGNSNSQPRRSPTGFGSGRNSRSAC